MQARLKYQIATIRRHEHVATIPERLAHAGQRVYSLAEPERVLFVFQAGESGSTRSRIAECVGKGEQFDIVHVTRARRWKNPAL